MPIIITKNGNFSQGKNVSLEVPPMKGMTYKYAEHQHHDYNNNLGEKREEGKINWGF